MKNKNTEEILSKLNITELNDMQLEAISSIRDRSETILLSPTGTGKTVAFLLPIVELTDKAVNEIQVLIIVPTRELAIQIEQVGRQMGTGLKMNAVYGGQNFSKDLINLKQKPQVLIGTPGRLADHIRRETISPEFIDMVVLDEFDKGLEIGFEIEMREILEEIPQVKKKVLTSATFTSKMPDFIELKNPSIVDYLDENALKLTVKKIVSPSKDKLDILHKSLVHFGNQPGIVFCNYKEGIYRISEFLDDNDIPHGTYHGSLDQIDRERALIKFRNGTHQLILATDLASRGLDIPELKFIIHYHLPINGDAFIHRNGRTARMNREGSAYVLIFSGDELPHFIPELEEEILTEPDVPLKTEWSTLFISGGRKDKISKGDIAGFFIKQGEIDKDDLGLIELKQDCAFIGVKSHRVKQLIAYLDNKKIKKRKLRVKEV